MNISTENITWRDPSRSIKEFVIFLLLISAILTPVILSGPIALYANNYAEFHVSLLSMARILAPYLFVIPALAILFCFLAPIKQITIPTLTWLAIAIYAQGNFLIWDYGRFDGSSIKWQDHLVHGLIDYATWLVLALLIFIYRKQFIANNIFISLLLIILQLSLSFLEFSNSKASLKLDTPNKSSTKSLYSFSKKKNVLFILLDEFSSRAFYSSLLKKPELHTQWKDFTYYRDTTAIFPTTYPSLPAILTGKAIEENGSMTSYLTKEIPNSIPLVLKNKGFYSDLVTFHPLCKFGNFDSCQTLDQAVDNDEYQTTLKDLYKLIDLSLFRYFPNFIKKAVYNDRLWFLQDDGKSKLPSNHRYSVEFGDLFVNKANTNANKPTFKFLHFLIPHSPYTLESDCSRLIYKKQPVKTLYLNGMECSLKIADKIVSKVKELGIYNNTTIFLLSDHGTPIQFNNPGFGEKIHIGLHRAYPLLMVKPSTTKNSKLEIKDEPKSLLDVFAVLNQIENLNTVQANSQNTTRVYNNYLWKHDNWFSDTLPKLSRFEITGDSWDFKSWKKVSK